MSDPVETPAAVDAATPKTPEQFADVQASRDKAKAKLKDAEASFTAQGEELAKLRAQNDERATVDAAAKLESDTAAGKWQDVIGTKDQRIEQLLKENAEHAVFRESTARQTRQTALVDAIATEVPGASRFEVQAMINQLGTAQGVDISPESVSDDIKAVVLSKLKESAPALFAAHAQTPPPRAGAGIQTPPHQNDAAHWARRINGEA